MRNRGQFQGKSVIRELMTPSKYRKYYNDHEDDDDEEEDDDEENEEGDFQLRSR